MREKAKPLKNKIRCTKPSNKGVSANEGIDEFNARVELGSRIIGNRRCRDQKEGKQIERRFIQLGMSTQVFGGSDGRRRK